MIYLITLIVSTYSYKCVNTRTKYFIQFTYIKPTSYKMPHQNLRSSMKYLSVISTSVSKFLNEVQYIR